MLTPNTPEQLAEALASAASSKKTITLYGRNTKQKMAGPIEASDVTISTCGLTKVLQYEPGDLTISVEAGMPYSTLSRLVAEHRQMIPLDPPFSETATIGGVLATNGNGPRRLLYGTARDMVIGMKFATLEGKLIQSGGMVVKNVAGLDMAKLMIGSFGTLAAIAVVNFKLIPKPTLERTVLLSFGSLGAAIQARNTILKSVLQPVAIDLLNPGSAAGLADHQHVLAVLAGGNQAAIERYQRGLGALSDWAVLEGDEETKFWGRVRNYTIEFLDANPDGVVVRVSCTLKELQAVMESLEVPAIARAGSGVCYGYFASAEAAAGWMAGTATRGWKAVIEFAPEAQKAKLDLWPSPGSDFEMMKKVKDLFDPNRVLNRGRLYRRI